jgi:hypothetical protein
VGGYFLGVFFEKENFVLSFLVFLNSPCREERSVLKHNKTKAGRFCFENGGLFKMIMKTRWVAAFWMDSAHARGRSVFM